MIHVKMPAGLKKYFETELEAYKSAFKAKEFRVSWRHLERAHILGQAWPLEHTVAHMYMLKFAIKIKNTKEIFGQIPRLLVGGIKSFVGEIPVGNTGGADVPPLKPMEIPEDLKKILNEFSREA
jgi:hypothetical protein